MYRLLIVDDEPAIVDGLVQHFQETGEQELDICKAYSAKEALEIVKKTKIDLLLSDIRMPGRSGLQLIDDVLFYWPACRIILLTGHSEFDYALQAIQKNVDHYILKTEGIDVIHRAVKAEIEKFDAEYLNRNMLERARQHLTVAEPLLKKEFFEALLIGEKAEGVWQSGIYEGLPMQINGEKPLIMITGKVDVWEEKVSHTGKMEVYYALQNLFAEHLPLQMKAEAVIHDRSELVWFVQPAEDAGKFASENGGSNWRALIDYLKGMLEPIQNSCRDEHAIGVSFVVCSGPVGWDGISEQFEMMKAALKQHAVIGQSMAIIDLYKSDSWLSLDSVKPAVTNAGEFNKKLIALERGLEAGETQGAIALTKEMIGCLRNDMASNYLLGVERFYRLILAYMSYLNDIPSNDNQLSVNRIARLSILEPPVEWGAIQEQLERLSESICQLKKEQMENSENLIVERVRRFVGDNLSGDLSLARIAEVVYFNPSYLSRFYKRLTGTNLSDYINEVKAERASDMLMSTQLKVNEIALKLGFESPSYFTSFFRKMTGTSPQEFRETAGLRSQ